MRANYTVRNESLQNIIVSMDDDKSKTYTIPPNGEVVFKSYVLERPDFRVFGTVSNNVDNARLLTAKTASPLASVVAGAITVKYVFDGARLQ